MPRRNVVKGTPEQKREAVVEFCAGGGSAEKIANRYGVSHSNLYCWQEKLFAGESRDEMQKPEEPVTEAALETLRAENAALAEWAEALRRENQELERTRHRLQLEVDVLKKADEILKKSTLLSEISGDGAITPILVRSARQPPISLPGTSMQKSPTKSG